MWPWTDDTELACCLVDVLRRYDHVHQDGLAAAFAERFDPYRGYGGAAVVILHNIRNGTGWREAAQASFRGQGSMGNGAAMRVAPLGAWYAGDSRAAALEAMRSAEVTHMHAEGVLGAVAVAVAAAEAGWARQVQHRPEPQEYLDAVLAYLVPSRTQAGIVRAQGLLGVSVAEAAYELGNGSQVLAQDTVPFTLWVAATFLDDYRGGVTVSHHWISVLWRENNLRPHRQGTFNPVSAGGLLRVNANTLARIRSPLIFAPLLSEPAQGIQGEPYPR